VCVCVCVHTHTHTHTQFTRKPQAVKKASGQAEGVSLSHQITSVAMTSFDTTMKQMAVIQPDISFTA
jgi:hypothetical protein